MIIKYYEENRRIKEFLRCHNKRFCTELSFSHKMSNEILFQFKVNFNLKKILIFHIYFEK